jgi:hypothetical protein
MLMAAPTPPPYTPAFSYTAFEAANAGDPPPGSQMDADFTLISGAINGTELALADIRRTDGQLNNGLVTPDSLNCQVSLLLAMAGANLVGGWVTGTQYNVKDVCHAPLANGGGTFMCYRAHIAADTWADDYQNTWLTLTPFNYLQAAPIPAPMAGNGVQLPVSDNTGTITWQSVAAATGVPAANAGLNGNVLTVNPDGSLSWLQQLSSATLDYASTVARPAGDAFRDSMTVYWWGAVGDGVADDTLAIVKMINNTGFCRLGKGTFRITNTLTFGTSILFEGMGVGVSTIYVDITNPAVPAFDFANVVTMRDLSVGYNPALISGYETQGARVIALLDTWNGGFALYNSLIQNVSFGTCGTAIYAPSATGVGSVGRTHFDNLVFSQFTFRGMDMSGTEKVGNLYTNLSFGSSFSGIDTALWISGEDVASSIDDVTIIFMNAKTPVVFNNCRGLHVGTIYMVLTGVSVANSAYVTLNSSTVTIENLTIDYSLMTQANTACVLLGETAWTNTPGFPANVNPQNQNSLHIGQLVTRNLANPTADVTGYPGGSRGLLGQTGFQFITAVATTEPNWFVTIDRFTWNTSIAADEPVYEAFPADPNSLIYFARKDATATGGASAAAPPAGSCSQWATRFYNTDGQQDQIWDGAAWRAQIGQDSAGNYRVVGTGVMSWNGKTDIGTAGPGLAISNNGMQIASYNTVGNPNLLLSRNSYGNVAYFYYNSTAAGGIGLDSGGGVTYGSVSDYRLKNTAGPITGALQSLSAIPTYRGTFHVDPHNEVDMILAHEVAAIVPTAVIGAKDAVDAKGEPVLQIVDLTRMIPRMLAALTEAHNRIGDLERQVEALRTLAPMKTGPFHVEIHAGP